jgi:hypothetical protein
MAEENDWLKLQVGSPGKPLNADAFLTIFHNTIAALKAIDRGFSTYGAETIQWEVIGAGSNSPIHATIRGRDTTSNNRGHSRDVVDTFVKGIEHLSRDKTCPAGFAQDSLRYVQKIVSESKLHCLKPIYSTSSLEARITRAVAVNANRARRELEMRKSRLVEHGTIEGRLRELSESHSRDKLGVVDKLTGEVTQCYLRNEALEPMVLKGWKHRVAVTGDITIDRQSGLPVKVLVDEIRILRERSELPQIEDLHGIDVTNGVEPSEYVRRLRDAE